MTTIYEVNKEICAQLPPLTEEEKQKSIAFIKEYLENTFNTFYMLMNHEVRYFTLFNDDSWCWGDYPRHDKGAKTIFEIAESLGQVKTVTFDTSKTALEFWIDDKIYLFFPYDEGVVNY